MFYSELILRGVIMKYMHFKGGCSYAGIANMLELSGYDTEDYIIANKIKLPYMFDYVDGTYLAGTRLQNQKWFNLFLNQIGFRLVEVKISSTDLVNYLQEDRPTMIGIISNESKHAVIYYRHDEHDFYFINNKFENEQCPELIKMSATKLISSVPDVLTIGYMEKCKVENVDIISRLIHSAKTLEKMNRDLSLYCSTYHSKKDILSCRENLFRALFLEAPIMYQLESNEYLYRNLWELQRSFMHALSVENDILLSNYIDMELLNETIKSILNTIHDLIENS